MTREGPPNPVETSAPIRVTYGEVDRMGVAYYGNYLRWFEIGRAEHLRARGKAYSAIEADGLAMPVIEAYVRYRRPAAYDDLLEVGTVVIHADRARVKFGYRVTRPADNVLIAEGHTAHACVAISSGRPRRFPPEVLALLAGPGEA